MRATNALTRILRNFCQSRRRRPPRKPPACIWNTTIPGKSKNRFVNLLHLLRPIVVLDEAHRFVGDLSREVQRRINPSCIMEWTATPRDTRKDRQLHNILVSATAQELQDEEMIKLPFAVGEHDNWGNAVAGGGAGAGETGENRRRQGFASAPDCAV